MAAERARFAALLSATGAIETYPSQANYLLCRLGRGLKARSLAERLLEGHEIFIKDLSGKQGFPEGQFVRLAVRGPEDNDRLVAALRKTCLQAGQIRDE